MDLGSSALGILTGLGALAAGTGIFKAGISVGRLADRVPQALQDQAASQRELVDANKRQAVALEQSAKIVPLLEQVHSEREEIGLTLRAMARKLNTLLEHNGIESS